LLLISRTLVRYRYLLLVLMTLSFVSLAANYVWRNGLSDPVQVVGESHSPDLTELWFSSKGNLVEVARQDDAVTITPWVGERPATRIVISTRELVERAVKDRGLSLEAKDLVSLLRSGVANFAVARDLSKVFLEVSGYLVVSDLISKQVRVERLFEGITDVPDSSDRLNIVALAVTDRGLAVLKTNGDLEIRDFKTLGVVEKLRVVAPVDEPQALFASGPFVAVVSNYDVGLYDMTSLAVRTVPRDPSVNPTELSVAVSTLGRLAVSQRSFQVDLIDPPLKVSYPAPGRVSAINFLTEDQFLVGGDFSNIYLLSANDEPKLFAPASRGAKWIARYDKYLAYATPDQTVLLSTQNARNLTTKGRVTIIIAFFLLVSFISGVLMFFQLMERRLKLGISEVTRAPRTNDSPLPQSEPDETLRYSLPSSPPDLVEALAAGECVFYGGAGLGAQAGLPTWNNFLIGLLNWAVDHRFIDEERANSFRAAIDRGRADYAADSIYHAIQDQNALPALYGYLNEIFLTKAPVPDAYQALTSLRFAAVLTTNFDDLFERNYQDKAVSVMTPSAAEQLKTALSKYEFFVLKLYGTLSQPETLMVAPAQYEDAVTGNRTFSEFMETLFFSKTILFVGASLEGIEAYLKGITLPKTIPRTHYALVAVEGTAWQSQADVLKRRYGIHVIPYSPTEDYPELKRFLENLADDVAAKGAVTQESDRSRARLKRLILKDVGPFEHLELEFDAKWNILLGDNGVGKSTILKAIAVAFCGRDAQPYARQLIRSGKESALIVLETDTNRIYETQILNRSGITEIISKPSRPLEIENWLVLGFSPLRTASWERPSGPEAEPRKKQAVRPSADDLLPLIKGGLDPRIDKLKQWIVNLDYWKSKAEAKKKGEGAQYEKMIQEFFELVDHLTIDLQLKYLGIDEAYGIQVETNDGKIPIESVSQGTTSLTGWAGILLQRLNDVYGYDNQPTSKYALVLMDEIDAHMHPAWQQELVTRFSQKFKEVQVIATTHSPLMVGGMRSRQLFRFTRDQIGKIVQVEVDREMALGRADQVLTSDLFGLETTVDPKTQTRIAEYQQLLSIDPRSRNEEQQQKVNRLQTILGIRIPETGETAPERRAQELLQVLLMEQFEGQFPHIQKQILDRARKLLSELQKKGANKR
jgi:predicted ATP-binding protein involved in virulence